MGGVRMLNIVSLVLVAAVIAAVTMGRRVAPLK
jgi:hypothetical protein